MATRAMKRSAREEEGEVLNEVFLCSSGSAEWMNRFVDQEYFIDDFSIKLAFVLFLTLVHVVPVDHIEDSGHESVQRNWK